MTTIACDGKSMAADTQVSSNYIIDNFNFQKIFKLDSGEIIGLSGETQDSLIALDWYKAGADESKKPSLEKISILILKERRCFVMEYKLKLFEVGIPTAVGSGRELALGAMYAGATARQAVEIAIKYDSTSGGEIMELFPDGP